MTQPAYQPSYSDEMRSLQRYISWAFPTKEIARSRKGDSENIDILITAIDGLVDPHNRSASFTDTPIVIYYNATDYDDAAIAVDKFITLFQVGMSVTDHSKPGYKQRVPMWQWPAGGTPAPDGEAVMGWLRIKDVAARVVEQEEPGRYIAVCEFRSGSYRVTYDDSQYPTLTNVNINISGVN